MTVYDVLWIEDEEEYQEGILYGLDAKRVQLGFTVVPWHYLSYADLEEKGTMNLSSLHMTVAVIDYNLPGIDGDAIIEKIRSHKANDKLPIIFYSGGKNIEELEALTSKYANIIYSQKGTLSGDLEDFLLSL